MSGSLAVHTVETKDLSSHRSFWWMSFGKEIWDYYNILLLKSTPLLALPMTASFALIIRNASTSEGLIKKISYSALANL